LHHCANDSQLVIVQLIGVSFVDLSKVVTLVHPRETSCAAQGADSYCDSLLDSDQGLSAHRYS
jgi:hypothetical protein